MITQTLDLDPQDQRTTSGMEDSDAMTVEFLRARLLSERSISRSARQRADELAKKVAELEEQLRTVTLQRKMAEKATADVLAILENQGISDLSEESDSGSDLDTPREFDASNESPKDELYGSHVDYSPLSDRSLSWKGRHDSPRSLEKYKTSNLRRQNSFSSIGSSRKHRPGKSCRKIRHRQTRSVEDSRDKSVKDSCQENESASSSEGLSLCSGGGSNILRIESKIPEEDESEVNLVYKNHHVDGQGREKDMEEALEHRAQLIDRFEAMEKAQREWEENFREKNSTSPDSCDQGNHSDLTEDKDESKAQISHSSKVVTSNAQEDKAEPRGVCLSEELFRSETRGILPKSYDDDTRGYNNKRSATFNTSDFLGQENSHFPHIGNQNESSVNHHYQSFDMNRQYPHGNGHPNSKPTYSFPTNIHGGPLQNDASRNKNDHYALVSREQSHEFGGVLESLKQARISLQQELNRLPLVEDGYPGKAIKPSAFVSKSEDRFVVPVSISSLFRLPTDFSDEATARFNVHDSTAGFSSNIYGNRGISRTSDSSQFRSNPHYGTTLSLSAGDQSLPTRYLENGSRFDSQTPSYSGKFIYPSFPINPSYQNATLQMPFADELSRPYSSRTVGVPLSNHFSYHGDHLR